MSPFLIKHTVADGGSVRVASRFGCWRRSSRCLIWGVAACARSAPCCLIYVTSGNAHLGYDSFSGILYQPSTHNSTALFVPEVLAQYLFFLVVTVLNVH